MSQFFSTRGALFVALLVFSTLISISYFIPALSGGLAVLVVGIVFLGIPHGALDIYLITKIVSGKKEILLLLLLYVLSIFPMIMAWKLIPAGAFLFFVFYSSFHFAQSDLVFARFPRIEFWTRFLSVFCFPFTFHTDKFLEYSSYILPLEIFELFIPLFQFGSFLAICGFILITFLTLKKFYSDRDFFSNQFLEPIIIFAIYFFMDPLYAFGIYFCFIHSIKHLVNIFTSELELSLSGLLPIWIFPLLAMIGILYNFGPTASSVPSETLSVITNARYLYAPMIVISAIALPHAILVNFSKKLGLIK